MKFSRAIKLKHKLLMLVALPLLLVLAYASYLGVERQADLKGARDVLHLARTTELLSIVHRLQFERGNAVALAANPSPTHQRNWQQAVKTSEIFTANLPALHRQLASEDTRPEVLEALDDIAKETARLAAFRLAFVEDKLNQVTVFDTYSETINRIHTSVGRLLKLAPGSDIFQLADALTAIAELKEIIGHERGRVAGILANSQASNTDIQRLIVLGTEKKIYENKFLRLAPVRFQEEYLRLQQKTDDNEFTDAIKEIIDAGPKVQLQLDSNRWFATASARIDQLREIEKQLNTALINYADNSRGKASSALISTLLISLITVTGISTLAWVATNRLAEGFTTLRDCAFEFVNSGELKSIPITGHDELGEVAHSFNQLTEQLRQISAAVEAVANGDLDQQVTVKSDRDRLALSLNHMIRTLNESVGRLQQENWLKSGQSSLANKINSDQNLQNLTQQAINFIADYIQAPVGAIYLVDKDESAELCASYAYTFRKEARNRFAKGESLVGQSVRERKTIIVDQLPPTYVSVSSGLGSTAPSSLAVIPLMYANQVLGVLELGCLEKLSSSTLELLEKTAENLAISIHAASSRERLKELLEETQAQAEELQAQQEELEQTNSELEDQTQQLRESQTELQSQQQQLVNTNNDLQQKSDQLALRNKEIEARSADLEAARKSLEVRAKQLASASKYKTEFLANMSHELRTPLNSLLLLAQSLVENDTGNLQPDQLEAVSIIRSSGHDLLTLINDILDLSKVEAGKLNIDRERCDITELCTQLRQQFAPAADHKNLKLIFDTMSDAPTSIFTDSQRLLQILRNLLGNAIKFTAQGEITVTIAPEATGGIQFCVKDSGIGVPEKLQEAIFEAFQQGDGSTRRKYSGTGLGLTISRELAQLLGGKISIASKESMGSTFTLSLDKSAISEPGLPQEESPSAPVSPTAKAVSTTTAAATATATAVTNPDIDPDAALLLPYIEDDRDQLSADKDTLLIIEDDKAFARCIQTLAHKRGFQCLIAGDAKTGRLMVDRYRPSAIVLDTVLPDASGQAIAAQFRNNHKTKATPVHLIASPDKRDEAPPSALDAHTKPIKKETIDSALKGIKRLLHGDKTHKILVIEDDADTRKSLELLLRQKGLDVLQADSGEAGLSILAGESIDCVILDLNLPDTNSLDLLHHIAGDHLDSPHPVIIYTGRDLSHKEYKYLRQYTDNIIVKGSLAQERLLNDVTLFLHSIASKDTHKTSMSMPADNTLEGKKILIVDDDMRNTFALANLLKRYGMHVVLADNGKLALEKLSECDDIKLAIMDIMMPVMDGFEAIKKIRQHVDYKDLPIIALTAKAMPEDRDRCLQIGANDYLAKPVDSHRLMSAIKVWGAA